MCLRRLPPRIRAWLTSQVNNLFLWKNENLVLVLVHRMHCKILPNITQAEFPAIKISLPAESMKEIN